MSAIEISVFIGWTSIVGVAVLMFLLVADTVVLVQERRRLIPFWVFLAGFAFVFVTGALATVLSHI